MKKERKNIFLLLSAKVISNIGDNFFDFSNNTWIASLGAKGQKILTIYQITESITGIVLNVFGGVFADNYNRKKIITITDLIAGVACLVLSIVYPTKFFIFAMILVNIILAILSSFRSPAYKSIIPNTVHKDKIVKVNSNLEICNQLVSVSSPVISLIAYKVFGIGGALLIDGISFLISALLNNCLQVIHKKSDENIRHIKNKIIKNIIEGIEYITKNSQVAILLIVSSAVNFFLAGYNYSFPFVNKAFGTGNSTYTILLVSQSLGGIIGGIISPKLTKNDSISHLLNLLTFCGLSIAGIYLLFQWYHSLLTVFVFMFLFHMLLTAYNIDFFSIIQTKVDDKYLGRVFSVVFTVAIIFMPIGTAVFSYYSKAYLVENYIIIGIGIIIVSIVAQVLSRFKGSK